MKKKKSATYVYICRDCGYTMVVHTDVSSYTIKRCSRCNSKNIQTSQ